MTFPDKNSHGNNVPIICTFIAFVMIIATRYRWAGFLLAFESSDEQNYNFELGVFEFEGSANHLSTRSAASEAIPQLA